MRADNRYLESLAQMITQASLSRHRFIVVLYGKATWANALAKALIQSQAGKNILWVGGTDQGLCRHRLKGHAHHVLGDEVDHVILEGYEGIHADDLGALVGVIRAGGLLLLLMPSPEEVKQGTAEDRFHRRLMDQIARDKDVLVLQQGKAPEEILTDAEQKQHSDSDLDSGQPTQEQQAIITGVSTLLQRKSGVISVIADRGRGKSSVLGMAAAELIRQGPLQVVITAPRRSAAEQVFAHAIRSLGIEDEEALKDKGLCFIAPDAVIASRPEADLLMVDEAASIPVQMLEELIAIYPRIVFATTVHGYEGSGRGFELRFSRILDSTRPGWQSFRPLRPIRWAKNDPLESFGLEALLMKAPVSSLSEQEFTKPDECIVERIDRDEIVRDEVSLAQLFGLLVSAHYRTRPYDLQFLLDSPGLQIYVVRWRGLIVAASLLAEEGGFDRHTSDAIFAGTRRPQGHLFAQSLSAHIGIRHADQHRYLRVIRIAVHPELQRKGLGRQLMKKIHRVSEEGRCDAIGVSFAADPGIIRFWMGLGFVCVHIGMTREHSTGSHSIMLMHALNDQGRKTQAQAKLRFAHRFYALRSDVFRDLPVGITDILDKELKPSLSIELPARDELLAYSHASRGFEVSKYAIQYFIEHLAADYAQRLDDTEAKVVRLRVFENLAWTAIARELGLSGRDEVRRTLRMAVARLIEQSSDPQLRAELEKWQSQAS
jgi:tRNA(Met) cytidine acetyltransferase